MLRALLLTSSVFSAFFSCSKNDACSPSVGRSISIEREWYIVGDSLQTCSNGPVWTIYQRYGRDSFYIKNLPWKFQYSNAEFTASEIMDTRGLEKIECVVDIFAYPKPRQIFLARFSEDWNWHGDF